MTTLKSFIEHSHINPKLIRAVVRQCGGWDSFKEMAVDVTNHGADAGYSGFTYYNETVSFTKNHKAKIMELAKNLADDLGEDVYTMIGQFNVIKEDASYAAEAIHNPRSDNRQELYNVLAWFALEEVSRSYVDWMED